MSHLDGLVNGDPIVIDNIEYSDSGNIYLYIGLKKSHDAIGVAGKFLRKVSATTSVCRFVSKTGKVFDWWFDNRCLMPQMQGFMRRSTTKLKKRGSI